MSHDCKRMSTEREVALKEAKTLRHENQQLRALLTEGKRIAEDAEPPEWVREHLWDANCKEFVAKCEEFLK